MPNPVDRRTFIAGTAAAGAAMSLPAASYARIQNANAKLRVGFLGVGGRCQQHIDVIPSETRKRILDKRNTRLVKGEDGSGSFEAIDWRGLYKNPGVALN